MEEKSLLYKIRFGVLCLAAAFPLLVVYQVAWISWAAAFIVLAGLINLIVQRNFSFEWKKFFFLSLPFLAYVLALTQTQNTEEGVAVIQKKLLLLLLPFAFAFKANQINETDRGKLFLVFQWSALAVGLYANAMIRIKGFTITDPSVNDYSFLYRTALEHYSNLHPTYFAVILFFAAFLSINNLVRDWKKRNENKMVWMELVLSVLLVTMAIASAARAPLFAFGVVLFAWMFIQGKNAGKTWLAFLVAGIFVLSLLALPSTRHRISEMLNPQNFSAPTGQGLDNGTNVRAGIYQCNWQILKEHWLIGVGTGDVQTELNECYSQYKNTEVYKNFEYNTHNEYLHVWFSAGIVGLLMFMASLYFSFVHAVQHQKYTYLFFLLFISICFFTENLLSRQAGIMFYIWFQCLFLFTPQQKNV